MLKTKIYSLIPKFYTVKEVYDLNLLTSPKTNLPLSLAKIQIVFRNLNAPTIQNRKRITRDQVLAYKQLAELFYKFNNKETKQNFINELQRNSTKFFTPQQLITTPFSDVFSYNPFEKYIENHLKNPQKYKNPNIPLFIKTEQPSSTESTLTTTLTPLIVGLVLSRYKLYPIWNYRSITSMFKRLKIDKMGNETLKWYNKMNEKYFFLYFADKVFSNTRNENPVINNLSTEYASERHTQQKDAMVL